MDKDNNPESSSQNTRYLRKEKIKLLKKVIDLKDEIRHRKNIFAGVCKNSILAQQVKIFNLEKQYLDHKYQNEPDYE